MRVLHTLTAIHAWNLDMLIATKIAKWSLRHCQVAFTLQDTTPWMLSKPCRLLQKWAYRRVDKFFVTSEQFVTHFLRRFRLIPETTPVTYVPNVPQDHLPSSHLCSA